MQMSARGNSRLDPGGLQPSPPTLASSGLKPGAETEVRAIPASVSKGDLGRAPHPPRATRVAGVETPVPSGCARAARREAAWKAGARALHVTRAAGGGRRRTGRASHVVRLQPRRRRRRRRARARPCGGSPGGVGRTIMKDSASAASARAEFVLRFPWAVPVRRPQLPTPETLPDRWLQAAEEEEEELLPFRSPPREENGTAPTQSPAGGGNGLGGGGQGRGRI